MVVAELLFKSATGGKVPHIKGSAIINRKGQNYNYSAGLLDGAVRLFTNAGLRLLCCY
jgi:hypothetical protein